MKRFVIIVIVTYLHFSLNAQNCNLQVSFGGKTGTFEMTKDELTSVKNIIVVNSCSPESQYKIISYNVTCKIKSAVLLLKGVGNVIHDEIKVSMTSANHGSKIFIDNVKAKSVDGKISNSVGVTIKVK